MPSNRFTSIILSQRCDGRVFVKTFGFLRDQASERCCMGEGSGTIRAVKVNVEGGGGPASREIQVVAGVEYHVSKVGESRVSKGGGDTGGLARGEGSHAGNGGGKGGGRNHVDELGSGSFQRP